METKFGWDGIDSVSIRVRSRERTIPNIDGPSLGRICFNPRSLSRANDLQGTYNNIHGLCFNPRSLSRANDVVVALAKVEIATFQSAFALASERLGVD